MSENGNYPYDLDGSAFSFSAVTPEALPILAGFAGFPGCGKTLSSLLFARGLVGPRGKILLSDTENRRAKAYHDRAGAWLHSEFHRPYSPDRFIAALDAAEAARADAYIIDSGSTEWNGDGGVIDMAERSKGKGLNKWRAPKMRHNAWVARVESSSIRNIICCLRAKEDISQVEGADGKTEIIKGDAPLAIQGKLFAYSMMLGLMFDDNKRPGTAVVYKCPGFLLDALEIKAQGDRTPRPVSEEMGAAVTRWCAARVQVDTFKVNAQSKARQVAAGGSVALNKWWREQTPGTREAVKEIGGDLRSIANEADEAAKAMDDEPPANGQPPTDLSQPFERTGGA